MNEDQTRLIIILGSVLAVLLLILIVVLVTRGDGSDTVAAASTTTTIAAAGDGSTTTATEPTTTTTTATTTTVLTPTTATTTTTAAPATTAAPTTVPPPPPDFALRFDGVDDFVSVFDSGDFDFGVGMTIEAWVHPTSLPATGVYAAVVQGAFSEPPFSGAAWTVFLDNDDHSDWGLSGCTPACNSAKSGPGGLVVGEWQHIAATFDGVTVMIYRNGAFVTSNPLSGSLSDVAYLLIGTWNESFRGYIDEVRAWNHSRLPTDIQADHNRILAGNEIGLVGYWRFNEGDGQVAGDTSAAGNDGKLGLVLGADSADPSWAASDVPVG
jgi:hypothetical protein